MRHEIVAAGVVAMALLLTVPPAGLAEGAPTAGSTLAEATVVFEQNATDGDVEVVFVINSGPIGVRRLSITAPHGREVVRFECPAPQQLGMRQFRFESPEPQDSAPLESDFPEGEYRFQAETVEGSVLEGAAELSHELPEVVEFVNPREEAEDVSWESLEIRWSPVRGVAAYTLEIDQEETGANLAARVPSGTTSFTIPPGFLGPGLEYQLGIGTESEEGNLSIVETSFATIE